MSSDQELLTLLNNRISKTTKLIKDKQADALVIFNQANYRFLTNFSGEEAELILTGFESKNDGVVRIDNNSI